MGLEPTETYKLLPDLTEFHVDKDGVDLSGSYPNLVLGDAYENQSIFFNAHNIVELINPVPANMPYSYAGNSKFGSSPNTGLPLSIGFSNYKETFHFLSVGLVGNLSGGEILEIFEVINPGGLGPEAYIRIKVFYTKMTPLL
jgi:hypothetical protein